MTSYLFDASALVYLLLDASAPLVPRIRGGRMLDLTAYEVGSALWKQWRVRRTMSFEDVSTHLGGVPAVFRALKIIRFDELGVEAMNRAAKETGLSFYDSAYVAAAVAGNLELVTADERLRKGASGRVTVRSPTDL
jgi:predicted nucleic acid-binding protein